MIGLLDDHQLLRFGQRVKKLIHVLLRAELIAVRRRDLEKRDVAGEERPRKPMMKQIAAIR